MRRRYSLAIAHHFGLSPRYQREDMTLQEFLDACATVDEIQKQANDSS